MITITFVTLTLAILAYNSLNSHYRAMVDFMDNWRTQPLVDLKVSQTSCPPGYTSLIDRFWPGTIPGCDCRFSVKYINDLYTGSCDQNQTEANCYDIYAKSSQPLPRVYSNLICGARGGDTFEKAVRPDLKGECPDGYYKSHEGTLNNVICLKNSDPQPISNIMLLEPNSDTPPGYTELVLTDGYRLAFTKTSDSLPMIRFRLTEHEVCADKSQYTKTPGRGLYKLINTNNYYSCSNKLGGVYYDNRYLRIGEVRESRLFNDNGVTRILATLPLYPMGDADNYNWGIFQNAYYRWDLACEEEKGYDRAYFIQLITRAVQVGNKQLTLMFVCILNTIICSCIFGIISIVIAIKQLNPGYYGSKSKLICFSVTSNVIKWGFYALKVVYLSKCIHIINQYQDSIVMMNAAQCSDDMANRYMSDYGESLLGAKSKNHTSLIMTIVSISTSLLFLGVTILTFGIKYLRGR